MEELKLTSLPLKVSFLALFKTIIYDHLLYLYYIYRNNVFVVSLNGYTYIIDLAWIDFNLMHSWVYFLFFYILDHQTLFSKCVRSYIKTLKRDIHEFKFKPPPNICSSLNSRLRLMPVTVKYAHKMASVLKLERNK